jgi:hypothetical protein
VQNCFPRKVHFYLPFTKQKSPLANAKGLGIVKLPRQDEFRNFCMREETEKVYLKLEEIICA